MFIKSLSLKNFRSYSQETIDFKNGINIMTGANAQGKTNAAEAIFFLCTGYSPRANRDKLVIKSGEDCGEISAVAQSIYGDITVKIIFHKNENKSIFVNGVKVSKIGEILGNMNSVFFNPSELKLVQESPEDRRRFMNISLSQMSKPYFYALSRYNKILAQRNNLLKTPDFYLVRETLPVWDKQLSSEAGKIIKARNDFLNELVPLAQEKHSLLTDGKEILLMKTESGYKGTEIEIAEKLYQDLKNNIDRDIRLGFTSIGPHRDDIKFTLNGDDVRVFGSQGQQRTVALSIKLAETEMFFHHFNEYPILILDDVLSELDKSRQKKLVGAVTHLQTIFTATHLDRQIFKGLEFNHLVVDKSQIAPAKKRLKRVNKSS